MLLAGVKKQRAKGSSCQSPQEVDSVKCFHALPLRLSRDALRQRPPNAGNGRAGDSHATSIPGCGGRKEGGAVNMSLPIM